MLSSKCLEDANLMLIHATCFLHSLTNIVTPGGQNHEVQPDKSVKPFCVLHNYIKKRILYPYFCFMVQTKLSSYTLFRINLCYKRTSVRNVLVSSIAQL